MRFAPIDKIFVFHNLINVIHLPSLSISRVNSTDCKISQSAHNLCRINNQLKHILEWTHIEYKMYNEQRCDYTLNNLENCRYISLCDIKSEKLLEEFDLCAVIVQVFFPCSLMVTGLWFPASFFFLSSPRLWIIFDFFADHVDFGDRFTSLSLFSGF